MTTTSETSSNDAIGADVQARPSTTAAASRWLPIAGGLVGGIVAAGAAGTSTETIFLGAVWAGTATGMLIVALSSYLAVARLRSAMPVPIFRRLAKLTVRRTVSWALGAYVFWFLIIEPALSHAGIFVPMLRR